MGEPESGATDCLLAYAKQCGISIDLQSDPMGIGEDGIVWKSSRLTALKAFYREKNFLKELDCYERLAEFGVTDVAGFTVPELLGTSGQFLVLELGIVHLPDSWTSVKRTWIGLVHCLLTFWRSIYSFGLMSIQNLIGTA